MQPLVFSPEGYLEPVKNSWNNIAHYLKSGKRKKIEKACWKLSHLVKILHELPKYRTLEYIPSGRLVDLAFSLKKVKLTKKELSTKVGKSFYLPSILYGVASGYIIAFKEGNRLYAAGSSLADLLVEGLDALKKSPESLESVLSYLFGGFLLPSRASFMYLTMKSAESMDPQDVEKIMLMHFSEGDYRGYEGLALTTLIELRDTWYLGKFKSPRAKKEYVTPSHAAYVLAKTFNDLVNVEDYLTLLIYVSGRRGMASLNAFDHLLSQVRYSESGARELLEKHPVISRVKDLVQLLKDNYSELDKEVSKLSSW
ncbi:MAG: hypothetical protein QXJ97_03680 [Desulfurococcaceae archaeon]